MLVPNGVDYRGVSNHWYGIWNGMMEWKMEWNSEHTQLQLTRVSGMSGATQSRLNYLYSVSLGLLSHRRSFMSNYGIAYHYASLSGHGTVAGSIIIRCFVIVVLQSQTLERKTRVWLRKTIV